MSDDIRPRDPSGARRRSIERGVVAWVAFTVFHMSLVLTYTEWGPVAGVRFSVIMGTVMLGLAWCVWRFTEAVPWPTPFRFTFLLAVGAGAAAFGVVYQGFDRVVTALHEGNPVVEHFLSTPMHLWDSLVWSFLGSTLLVLFYGVHGHEEAHRQRLAAAEAQAGAAQARLDTLRGQLNAHFLYNALHSITAMVGLDPPAAQRSIAELGDLLRYTLAPEDRWEVPLREEWAFTRSYLAIEKTRLAERLTLDVDLDPESLDQGVPRFSLQPLVENAIRHGISKRPEGGTLRIRTWVDRERLVIEVVNDGSPTPSTQNGGEGGSGLRNLRARLTMHPSGHAALSVDERSDGTVVARVELPSRA